jgi:hypothetical protein
MSTLKRLDKYYMYGTAIFIIGTLLFLYLVLKPFENFQESATPSFHVLIATAGRLSLQNLLDTLKDELTERDAITIVFDGPDAFTKSTYQNSWIKDHKSRVSVIVQDDNTGFWGHPIRQKYVSLLSPKTTYIMHADDDDQYIPGSFNTLRQVCVDPETLYISKMNYSKSPGRIVPKQNSQIIASDIGTPNGIIPFDLSPKGEWGMRDGGDFDYYNTVQQHAKHIVFLDTVIYTVNER